MARKSASATPLPRKSVKRARKSSTSSASPASSRTTAASAGAAMAALPEAFSRLAPPDIARMAKLMTPEQAIALYKANAKMALDVINAALDTTTKMRKLQFEGEETAREVGRRAARNVAEAKDPQSLVAVGQEAGREALEKSLAYWNDMFALIVEMQKRLFTLMQEQAEGVPGVKEAKAAMAMMPDLTPMKNMVTAMQGMIGSGTGAFTSMQKMMADMARMSQSAMPGGRR
ncbi:MAG TPA: phasin family protein [Casimicrobiaceae bacterium]|nr:phasin family protein [Casimicrobiaceae bacterium]